MSACAVETIDLGKTFRKKKTLGEILRRPFLPGRPVRALDGVSLRIAEREIFGLLGPNGAGKTTLIKILSSLVLPTNGSATIRGHDAGSARISRRLLGLVTSDERSFYWRLTGRENLRFFGRLHGLDSAVRKARIDKLLERLDLGDAADKAFSTYSSGMKQRLSVARALLHDPPVLLLDEPTRSLDPVASRSLRRFVRDELNGRDGKTILLATHDLHEAEELCARIAILAGGTVRALGPPKSIRRFGLPADVYRLDVIGPLPGRLEGLRRLGPVPLNVEADEFAERIEITLKTGDRIGPALAALVAAGTEIVSCERLEPDLEEAFERVLAGRSPEESDRWDS